MFLVSFVLDFGFGCLQCLEYQGLRWLLNVACCQFSLLVEKPKAHTIPDIVCKLNKPLSTHLK